LITQVAGRAGRRTDPGLVLIQSSITKHPVLEHILSGDWQQFIEEELNNRKRSGFPPAARLILLRSKGKNESAAVRALLRMRRLLQKDKRITTLGPAPAVISRMKGDYRFNLLVRTLRENDPAGGRLRDAARRALDEYKTGRAEPGVTIDLDVDPQTVT